jgi:hypothetical protein
MLEEHDWYFTMSDDRSVYLRGSREESELKAISSSSPERKALYDEYYSYQWKGTEKPAKPLF